MTASEATMFVIATSRPLSQGGAAVTAMNFWSNHSTMTLMKPGDQWDT
jgi:hypothetical protein